MRRATIDFYKREQCPHFLQNGKCRIKKTENENWDIINRNSIGDDKCKFPINCPLPAVGGELDEF